MTPRLRVALLTSYPTDHETFGGGVQSATAALLEGLRELRDETEVHVVAGGEGRGFVREAVDGVDFHFLPAVRHRWQRPRFPYRIASAAGELRRIRPDVVHCQDSILLAPAASAGRWATLFTVHGIKRAEARFRTGWEGAAARFESFVEDAVRGRFDALVCNSEYAAREAGRRKPVFRIPNALPARFFDVERRPGDDPLLLFVGALTPLKRPGDLVTAHGALLGEHPRLRSVFCGEVQDAAYAGALARRDVPGVTWEGLVGRARIVELLSSATAVVVPSMQENVPMVIAEAMAAGVPVVASRVGGIPEMVEGGATGLLYQAGDVEALGSRLRELLDDPERAARMGAAARERARAVYAPAAVANATIDAYRAVLARRGS